MQDKIFNSEEGLQVITQTAKVAYLINGNKAEKTVVGLICLMEKLVFLKEITREQFIRTKTEILNWVEDGTINAGDDYPAEIAMACMKWLNETIISGETKLQDTIQYLTDYWKTLYQIE